MMGLLLFFGCEEKETSKDLLTVQATGTSVGAEEATVEVAVVSTTNWEATKQADWITVNPSHGTSADTKATVEVAANTTRRIIKPFIELLAALPSVVIGFIGMVLVAPWLQNTLGIATGLNLFNAALMLAFMAVPTICSIAEDALHAVPRSLKDASLALGATPWETLKNVTFPYALSGVGTAVMLGMSRALGETMVVLMVAGGAAIVPESIFDPIRPMPASIAAEMAEAPFGSPHYHALFATGIALFVMTFIFNAIAFRLAQKYKTPAV